MSTNIIFEEIPGNRGNIGLITLNRQEVLNALNHEMFIAIETHLSKWQTAKSIKAVIIKAADGRAFSAGGDIRSVYEKKIRNALDLSSFFPDEYQVNRSIFHYPKPYIALLNGITMGGGAGISIHGSHRVATEHLVFGMPETTIGFYPDIGASYFLSRLPKAMGLYLGLTGEKISYSDCYALGLVDFIIDAQSQDHLIKTLAETTFINKKEVSTILQEWSIPVPVSDLLSHQEQIHVHFSKNTVEEMIQSLEKENTDWSNKTVAILKNKSPTSLKVTYKEISDGKYLTFDACMQMESKITQQMLKEHDFFEGIRALIIDKDKKPSWLPNTLEEVTSDQVNAYF